MSDRRFRPRGRCLAGAAGTSDPLIDDTTAPVINGCILQPWTDCSGVNLTGANLAGVDLAAANLSQATFDQAPSSAPTSLDALGADPQRQAEPHRPQGRHMKLPTAEPL
ncbi:MAG: pentapeptide repeat-containing protein [Actinomycetota bacterium]|nr:pentapeptide repeat-containing protein [Actinomycetota bacterium]